MYGRYVVSGRFLLRLTSRRNVHRCFYFFFLTAKRYTPILYIRRTLILTDGGFQFGLFFTRKNTKTGLPTLAPIPTLIHFYIGVDRKKYTLVRLNEHTLAALITLLDRGQYR